MTFPHVDPDFTKKVEANVPEHLTQRHIKRVFDVNNKVMESWLNCKSEEKDCPECGNEECFKAFKEQADLWGVSLSEYLYNWKKQREEDKKAAEAQTARYARYYADYNYKLIDGYFDKKEKSKNTKSASEKGLFG